MTQTYSTGFMLFGALFICCAAIGAMVLGWAVIAIVAELRERHREHWRRVSHKPSSRFYVPKGRL